MCCRNALRFLFPTLFLISPNLKCPQLQTMMLSVYIHSTPACLALPLRSLPPLLLLLLLPLSPSLVPPQLVMNGT